MIQDSKKLFAIKEIKKITIVSRETIERLQNFTNFLIEQNKGLNLIGKSTVENIWNRHILDSAQILKYIPNTKIKLGDFGSGAGLPGIVLSILGISEVYLIDKSFHKCRFLEKAKKFSTNKIWVYNQSIEELKNNKNIKFDIITARALAPLNKLITMTRPFAHQNTIYIFLKGKKLQEEMDQVKNNNKKLEMETYPSITSPEGKIVVIKNSSLS